MCGIAGKLWLDPARPADRGTVAAMTDALAHRGPDDRGLATDGPLAFGHRRLTIVDLSPRGRQPMASADGRCLIVVNGEIYNHRALRAELEAKGHRFRSDCDSEVLLPLYLEHWESDGPLFVDRLDGMFAFALWDREARRLVLGRDRVGQKPLVYARGPGHLSFASELPALGLDPDVDRTPDWTALSDYLSFRVIPHPRTAWVGARKLHPGHVLVEEGGETRLERVFRLAPGPETNDRPTPDDAAAQVRDALDGAVRKRLMSDVPLGAFLSGGLDSAAVVASMAAASPEPVRTFTIGFEERDYDETADARKVSALFGTRHTERIVRPDAVALVGRILRHHGEPFADSSSIPTFLVSEVAREHVKVVLTGDGGDEAFAGYDRYRALRLAETLSAPSRAALGVVARLGGAATQRAIGTRARRLHDALALPPRQRNHVWRLGTDDGTRARLLTPEGAERLGPPTFYGPTDDGPLGINQACLIDVERYLPDDILPKVDVATMARGLEARSPFLDADLLRLALSLPASLKLDRRGGKRVLRRALRDRLPPDVLDGPKRGFGAPLDHWFRGPLLAHAREVLLTPAAAGRGLFDPRAVEALIAEHASGAVAAHEVLYTLLVLERWFVDQDRGA